MHLLQPDGKNLDFGEPFTAIQSAVIGCEDTSSPSQMPSTCSFGATFRAAIAILSLGSATRILGFVKQTATG